MNANRNNSKFREEWSEEVEKLGFYQLPHDFIRNLGTLDLSPIQALMIILLLGYGAKQQISAKRIASELNISEKSVRNAFIELSRRRIMHRNFGQHGSANTFTFGGLKKLVRQLALDRQRGMQNMHSSLGNKYPKSKQNLSTNKEQNINIYKQHGKGYETFQRAKAELIKKKSV